MTLSQEKQWSRFFLTETSHMILHRYGVGTMSPNQIYEEAGVVWYKYLRNNDYRKLEKASGKADDALADIILQNKSETITKYFKILFVP